MAEQKGGSGSALSREEYDSWRVFIETTEGLRGALAGRFQTDSGISAGDYQVLLALSEAEGRRMRSSELAEGIGWERSRLSHHLGRMEQRGLIRRETATTDSRGSEAVLTEDGRDALRRSSVPHFHAIRELFLDALTPAQLAAARDLAETLRDHLAAREKPKRG
jgi:DNA-binding MarR family transcriptional regulator